MDYYFQKDAANARLPHYDNRMHVYLTSTCRDVIGERNMAALRRLTRLDPNISKSNFYRNFSQIRKVNSFSRLKNVIICAAGGSLLFFASLQWKGIGTVHAYKVKKVCLSAFFSAFNLK